MKRKIKMCSWIMAGMLAMFAITGCGSMAEETEGVQIGEEAAEGGQNTASEDAKYVIRYSHVQSTSTPTHQAMEWLKNWLEEQSGGEVTMEIYPAGQLYDDSTEIDAITAGNIDMISTYISKLTTLDTNMQYTIAPFLFDSTEQMLACYEDPDVQEVLFKNLSNQGITVLGGFYGGDTMLFSGSKEIRKPEDFRGFKVRENGGAMVQEQYSAMDASVVTVSYSELYTAIQSGLADAVCTTLDGVTGIALQEVLSYGLNLDHQQACYLIQFNTDTFNSYPQEVQDLIREGVKLASQKELEICKENRDGYLSEIEAGGCVVENATEEEKNAFRAIWEPISEKYMPEDWATVISDFKANYTEE